eukprot:m.319854 g.319854  ORF g.319854 m.319854 type:complete len:551 (-) comp19705_c0_seq7:270-1922(-)
MNTSRLVSIYDGGQHCSTYVFYFLLPFAQKHFMKFALQSHQLGSMFYGIAVQRLACLCCGVEAGGRVPTVKPKGDLYSGAQGAVVTEDVVGRLMGVILDTDSYTTSRLGRALAYQQAPAIAQLHATLMSVLLRKPVGVDDAQDVYDTSPLHVQRAFDIRAEDAQAHTNSGAHVALRGHFSYDRTAVVFTQEQIPKTAMDIATSVREALDNAACERLRGDNVCFVVGDGPVSRALSRAVLGSGGPLRAYRDKLVVVPAFLHFAISASKALALHTRDLLLLPLRQALVTTREDKLKVANYAPYRSFARVMIELTTCMASNTELVYSVLQEAARSGKMAAAALAMVLDDFAPAVVDVIPTSRAMATDDGKLASLELVIMQTLRVVLALKPKSTYVKIMLLTLSNIERWQADEQGREVLKFLEYMLPVCQDTAVETFFAHVGRFIRADEGRLSAEDFIRAAESVPAQCSRSKKTSSEHRRGCWPTLVTCPWQKRRLCLTHAGKSAGLSCTWAMACRPRAPRSPRYVPLPSLVQCCRLVSSCQQKPPCVPTATNP